MLDQSFDDSSPWDLDTCRDKLWLSPTQLFQVLNQLCDTTSGMLNGSSVDHTSSGIQNTYFMTS
jgi:hypothetical protein